MSIGAAFVKDFRTGAIISMAIMCEEFPHELGMLYIGVKIHRIKCKVNYCRRLCHPHQLRIQCEESTSGQFSLSPHVLSRHGAGNSAGGDSLVKLYLRVCIRDISLRQFG